MKYFLLLLGLSACAVFVTASHELGEEGSGTSGSNEWGVYNAQVKEPNEPPPGERVLPPPEPKPAGSEIDEPWPQEPPPKKPEEQGHHHKEHCSKEHEHKEEDCSKEHKHKHKDSKESELEKDHKRHHPLHHIFHKCTTKKMPTEKPPLRKRIWQHIARH